jgi:hypothetical protein
MLGLHLEHRIQAAEEANVLLKERVQKLEDIINKQEMIEPKVEVVSKVVIPPEFTTEQVTEMIAKKITPIFEKMEEPAPIKLNSKIAEKMADLKTSLVTEMLKGKTKDKEVEASLQNIIKEELETIPIEEREKIQEMVDILQLIMNADESLMYEELKTNGFQAWIERAEKDYELKASNQKPYNLMKKEQVISIILYTYPSPIFPKVNECLRKGDISNIQKWKSYAKMLYLALRSTVLPQVTEFVHRGIKDFTQIAKVGDVLLWQQFTSSSKKQSIADGFGGSSTSTLYKIRSKRSKYVAPVSAFQGEEECIFNFWTEFKVINIGNTFGGVTMVELEEVHDNIHCAEQVDNMAMLGSDLGLNTVQLEKVKESIQEAVQEINMKGPAKSIHGEKVLVWVDDHPEGNEKIIQEARTHGIEVKVLKSTTEALHFFKTNTSLLERDHSSFRIITDKVRTENGVQNFDAGLLLLYSIQKMYGYSYPIMIYTSYSSQDKHLKEHTLFGDLKTNKMMVIKSLPGECEEFALFGEKLKKAEATSKYTFPYSFGESNSFLQLDLTQNVAFKPSKEVEFSLSSVVEPFQFGGCKGEDNGDVTDFGFGGKSLKEKVGSTQKDFQKEEDIGVNGFPSINLEGISNALAKLVKRLMSNDTTLTTLHLRCTTPLDSFSRQSNWR